MVPKGGGRAEARAKNPQSMYSSRDGDPITNGGERATEKTKSGHAR